MAPSPRPLALVTGASAGIGKELAERFAKNGCDLILVARRTDELNALAARLTEAHAAKVHVMSADLGDATAPRKLFDDVTAKGLSVEILINNAGFGALGEFATADLARMISMIQLNVVALTELTRLFLPAMVKNRRGKVLNVASTAAFQPGPLMAVYYATKAYVLSFSEALHEELRDTGVTVTCLCPGPTKTEFGDVADMSGTSLFSGPNVMAVGPVADAAFHGLMAGRRLVVPGFRNRLLIFAVRFAPRSVILKLVKGFQSKRKS